MSSQPPALPDVALMRLFVFSPDPVLGRCLRVCRRFNSLAGRQLALRYSSCRSIEHLSLTYERDEDDEGTVGVAEQHLNPAALRFLPIKDTLALLRSTAIPVNDAVEHTFFLNVDDAAVMFSLLDCIINCAYAFRNITQLYINPAAVDWSMDVATIGRLFSVCSQITVLNVVENASKSQPTTPTSPILLLLSDANMAKLTKVTRVTLLSTHSLTDRSLDHWRQLMEKDRSFTYLKVTLPKEQSPIAHFSIDAVVRLIRAFLETNISCDRCFNRECYEPASLERFFRGALAKQARYLRLIAKNQYQREMGLTEKGVVGSCEVSLPLNGGCECAPVTVG